jgi:hypothetical protein
VAPIVLAATAALSTLFFGTVFVKKNLVGSGGAFDMSYERSMNQTRPQNLQSQLEYYFSDDHLQNDADLRSNLSSAGFCSLEVIAGYKHVAEFAERTRRDTQTAITEAVKSSKVLETMVSEGVPCIRRIRPYTCHDLRG